MNKLAPYGNNSIWLFNSTESEYDLSPNEMHLLQEAHDLAYARELANALDLPVSTASPLNAKALSGEDTEFDLIKATQKILFSNIGLRKIEAYQNQLRQIQKMVTPVSSP